MPKFIITSRNLVMVGSIYEANTIEEARDKFELGGEPYDAWDMETIDWNLVSIRKITPEEEI